jgi:hypothetical protein
MRLSIADRDDLNTMQVVTSQEQDQHITRMLLLYHRARTQHSVIVLQSQSLA